MYTFVKKMKNMENPFKFGTIVQEEFFTDRNQEIGKIQQILKSENHLILISPRRFGKSSLIHKATKIIDRPTIYIDLQLVTDIDDFASQLLKKLFVIYKWERIKQAVKSFRIIPTISLHPGNNTVEVTFNAASDVFICLEDVLNLIEKLGQKGERPIVVIDEFQEIRNIGKQIEKKLRGVLQVHQSVNYVFLGSAESMMREIFEKKKSPFYHFGLLMPLPKIPYDDFFDFLNKRFRKIIKNSKETAESILAFTGCHPYYTQQLAFHIWMGIENKSFTGNYIEHAITEMIMLHDNDYERLWNTIRQTDKKILIALSQQNLRALNLPASTLYSGLKRLSEQGYVIKETTFEIDDPFFKHWIIKRREK